MKKKRRMVPHVIGIILIVLQVLIVGSGSVSKTAPWFYSDFMSKGTVGFDLVMLVGYFLPMIIGIILVVIAQKPKKVKPGEDTAPREVRICTKCGSKLRSNSDTCLICGTKATEEKTVDSGISI